MFNATGIFSNCVCAINPYCQRQRDLYSRITTLNDTRMYTITNTMPDSTDSCYALDSFLFSIQECFYSNSNCLSTLLTNMNMTYNQLYTEIPWFYPTPLDYDPLSNYFLPNSSLSIITKEMMIEQWNYTASSDQYYETCTPNYYTYSYTARTYNYIGVIAKIISTIGDLGIALRLITPQLVTFLYRIFETKFKASHENQMPFFTRMKILFQSFLKSLYTELVNLTIFASCLYVLLLIIGIVILSLQTLIQPEILTKTFARPSLETYTHLLQEHGGLVHCPCSITSSIYGKYIKIEPIFHQICLSEFVSEEWRMNITTGLTSNMFDYDRRDYHRFLSAHLQYLAGLCYLSNQAVNAFIQQTLSSLFVTIQLLPKLILNTQIEALIEENESNVPAVLLRLIFLYRNINHANAIVSAYGTNYDYLLSDRFRITRLLGLRGGLTVVLKWICPTLTCLLAKIFERWKKRIKRISPIYFISSGNN
ncbi:unnamed protein product [Adineta ricciae]|uniref:Uncharacterized protein n=1 Tax=Adineta ricciae TaxID=249248 RepID=A0A815AVQ5_ADIRI|nr:unnamed protein product [Adineta ricciae]